MPVGQALLAGSEGAAFGFFPILWIVHPVCAAVVRRAVADGAVSFFH
jgi:hypothetical protein